MRLFLSWDRLLLQLNVPHSRFPTAFKKFTNGWTAARAAVVEEPLPDLKNPNTFADSGIPTHAIAKAFLGMSQEPQERLWPKLADSLDRFHPDEHAPVGHIRAFEDLVLVIPTAEIGLDDAMFGLLKSERGPTVRRCVQRLDLIRIVREKLTQGSPIIAVFFLHETCDPGSHGNDAVLPHEADGFAVDSFGAAFVDGLEGRVVGAFESEKKAGDASLFI